MKYSIFLSIFLINLIISLKSGVVRGTTELSAPMEQLERRTALNRFGINDDSFEDTGEEENGEDSVEYSQLGPPDINAYLYGRSLKKGFNAWAGRRDVGRHYKNKLAHKRLFKMRQRRRPWGGSA